jgi:hypothetical protein
MSKITDVYSAVIDQIEALFPSKTRLHNAYNLEENPEIVRKDSWGLRVETATREDTEFCNLSLNRQFTIVFLRHFVSLAGKEDGFDAVTVSIMEDQQSFSNLFYSSSELGEQAKIDRIEISNISGIQELATGEKRYLYGEITFNILISELIN